MTHRIARIVGTAAWLACCAAAAASAADLRVLTKGLFAIPATTGNEEALAAGIKGALPKTLAVEDPGLSAVAVRLAGSPGPTLLLAALDGYGHIVSGITPEGLLTLDRAMPAPHARFDGYLLGQPVVITTTRGVVHGVVSQPAIHLLTPDRRRTLVDGFSLESAYVDVGVRSEKEARAKGIELLDPVTFPPVLTELAGDQWAGPSLGIKAAAAGLLAAVESAAGRTVGEETVVAWAAQTKSAARGRGARPAIGAARAKARWQPLRTVVVDVIAAGKGDGFPFPGGGPVLVQYRSGPSGLRLALEAAAAEAGASLQFVTAPDTPLSLPFEGPPGEVVALALPVRFLNTPSEVVSLKDLEALHEVLARFLQPGGAK